MTHPDLAAAPIVLPAPTAYVAEAPASSRSSGGRPTTPSVPAEERRNHDRLGWLVPDYAVAQTGGFIGLLTVGVGYALFGDRLNLGLAYGISPAFHSGRTVSSMHLGAGVRPLEVKLPGDWSFVPYLGGGFLVAFGSDYFWSQPARYDAYDSGYYPPTAWHFTVHLGLEVDFGAPSPAFERQGVFWEARTLDRFLVDWLSNTEVIQPWEAWSSAFGYRLAF